jgi:hypothetical protein
MSVASLITVLILYPLTLFGDGCVIVAIAIAATMGGRPWLWGSSFALFHAVYGVIGMLMASEIAEYSEVIGDLFILVGAGFLLTHFMHHRLHPRVGGDCSCEHHAPGPISTRTIISTASAFSLHSLASGAIVRRMTGEVETTTLVILLVCLSLVIGLLIGGILLIGERERMPILRSLDKLPSVVAAALAAVCCFSIYHASHDLVPMSGMMLVWFLCFSCLFVFFCGYKVHTRGAIRADRHVHTISRRSTGQISTKNNS